MEGYLDGSWHLSARRLRKCALALLTMLLAFGQVGSGTAHQVKMDGFSLIKANMTRPVTQFSLLTDTSTLNPIKRSTSDLDIRANKSIEVGSFRLERHGRRAHMENRQPFSLAPHAAGTRRTPPRGSHILESTAFVGPNAGGVQGTSPEITLSVANRTSLPEGGSLLPTLLGRYYVWEYAGSWHAGSWQRRILGMRYRPRQFQAKPFQGWDMLTVPGENFRTYTRADWLYLTLNRPATLVVLWRGALPAAWLQGWGMGPRVGGARSFIKVFPAGQVTLGAIGGITNEPYTVLFAEADGTPSAPPIVPAGLEVPQPNAPCPSWIHAQYMAAGHDGQMYRTWHPQIDPVYWCYFGHSHGSDPALFAGDVNVTFDYYADKGHRHEPHEGFKVFVINSNAHSMMFTAHLGSSEAGRACARVHSYDIALAMRGTGEVLADLRLKSDFGYTMAINEGSVFYRLKSPDCPDMATLPNATGGRVRIPIARTSGYETWSPSTPGNVLGLANLPVLVIDNPMTRVLLARNANGSIRLDSRGFVEYAGLDATGEAGERHWMSFPGGDLGQGFTIRAAQAARSGEFYTDYLGRTLLASDDPSAVRQFIKLGLDFLYRNDKIIFTQDAWQNTYETAFGELLRVDMNLEGSLKPPN